MQFVSYHSFYYNLNTIILLMITSLHIAAVLISGIDHISERTSDNSLFLDKYLKKELTSILSQLKLRK